MLESEVLPVHTSEWVQPYLKTKGKFSIMDVRLWYSITHSFGLLETWQFTNTIWTFLNGTIFVLIENIPFQWPGWCLPYPVNYQSGILWWACRTSLSCDLIKKAVRPQYAYRILCGSISILVLWHRTHTAQKHRTCDGWVLYNFKVYPIVPKNGNHSHIQEFLTWWSRVISTDVSLLIFFHLCVCNSLQRCEAWVSWFFVRGQSPFFLPFLI